MDKQNLPTQTDKNFTEKLKSVVSSFIGTINADYNKAINEMAESPAISTEDRYAAASLVGKEARRIRIRKKIAEKAASIPQDDEAVNDEKPSDDWMNRFFGTVEDVSDEDMQNVWAQILAGEVKHPKSFSFMAIDVLRNMTKEDANLFVKASKYICFRNFVITEKECGIQLDDKIRLTDLRLLSPEDLKRQVHITDKENVIDVTFTHAFKVVSPTGQPQQLQFEGRRLTQAGRELLSLVEKKENSVLLKYMIKKFRSVVPQMSVHRISEWIEDGSFKYYVEPDSNYQ